MSDYVPTTEEIAGWWAHKPKMLLSMRADTTEGES